MNNNYYKVEKAAQYLGLSKSTLYKLTSKGKIPFYKPGGGKIYFKLADLDDWIESGRQESDQMAVNRLLEGRGTNG